MSDKKKLFCGCLELTASSARDAPGLARTLCGDLYHLSGGSDVLLEFRRTAGENGSIEHLLIFYLWSEPEHGLLKLSTLCTSAQNMLRSAGYFVTPRAAKTVNRAKRADSAWTLTRGELSEAAMTSPTQYRSVEMAANCDLSAVYDLLAAECGLCFSVFLSPCILPPMRKQELRQRVADYTTLRDGICLPGAQMRDPIAKEAADRLTCRLSRLNGPQFSLQWVISGRVAQSAALLSRLKQSVLTPDGSPITAWKQTSLSAVLPPAPLGLPGDFGGVFSLDEAAAMFALPRSEHCGLALNPFSLLPQQPLPAQALTQREDVWSLGCTSDHGAAVRYPLSALKYHGLIVGRSGFGKTSAAQNLMKVLLQNKDHAPVPLIIAPIKSEFRNLAKLDPETLIFSDFSSTSPLLLNIFLPPPGVPAGQYKRVLTQIFTAAFSLPDPLPSLFEHAIAASYRIFGWTDDSTGDSPGVQIFSLHEFIQVFSRQIRRSGYSGEVKGNVMTGGINRLRALLDRCAQFNTVHSVSMEDLLTRPCVIELGGCEGEDKALTVTLLLLSLFAYIKCKRPNGSSFRNLIFLDEAHTLLNVTSSGSGESGVMVRQLLERLLLEARGSGVALLLADQFPELLGSGIISNTDFKLVYRLEGGQAEFMAEELGMSHEERRVLSRLGVGQALVSSHLQPVYWRCTRPTDLLNWPKAAT